MKIRDIMTTDVHTVAPESNVPDCLPTMYRACIRHLPVIDGEAVIGVLSIGDLVNWIIRRQEEEIHHLHHYISGSYPA